MTDRNPVSHQNRPADEQQPLSREQARPRSPQARPCYPRVLGIAACLCIASCSREPAPDSTGADPARGAARGTTAPVNTFKPDWNTRSNATKNASDAGAPKPAKEPGKSHASPSSTGESASIFDEGALPGC